MKTVKISVYLKIKWVYVIFIFIFIFYPRSCDQWRSQDLEAEGSNF